MHDIVNVHIHGSRCKLANLIMCNICTAVTVLCTDVPDVAHIDISYINEEDSDLNHQNVKAGSCSPIKSHDIL